MQKIIKKIKNKKVLILTHHNADIDAIASAISLKKCLNQFNVKSFIGVAESVSKAAKNIAKDYEILIDPDCKDFEYVIIVETSVPEQLKSIKNLKADLIIDHHPKGKLAEKAVCLIDEKEKSTSQLIYKIMKKLNCKFSKNTQKIIAAGIIADTAHLRLADKEVFKILSELDIDFSEVFKLLEIPQDVSEKIAILKATRRMDLYKFNDIILAISNLASHEAAACRGILRLGADIAVVITKKKKEMRISSRAKNKILKYNLDLSEVFKEVGKFIEGSGGGHDLAGSANGKAKDIFKTKKLVLNLISKKLGRYKKLK